MNILCVIVLLIIGFLALNKFVSLRNTQILKFKDVYSLANLPIITMYIGSNSYNFLVDSGASDSVIDTKMLENISYEDINRDNYFYGIDGNSIPVKMIEAELCHEDKQYKESFCVSDLSAAFDKLKEDFKIELHGIIGNTFLSKYSCTIYYDQELVTLSNGLSNN